MGHLASLPNWGDTMDDVSLQWGKLQRVHPQDL
jgi:hypothetical protein